VVQRLQHDRGAPGEGGCDAARIGRAAERSRPPGDVARVLRERDLRARLDQAEAGKAQAARADEPLDVRDGEEVVETALLTSRDDERLLLPVLLEELPDADRLDAAS
jgi:hypothetical protein